MKKGVESVMVSVIIPTFNRAAILPRAIESVLAQDYRPFEVLIIDDASTDNTQDIVRAFADDRLKYIRQRQNGGASRARNTGIELAKGEFIAFLDSDDEWDKNKLKIQMVDMFKAKDPYHCVSYSQVLVDYGTLGRELMPKAAMSNNSTLANYLFGSGLIHTSSVLLAKKLLANNQFNTKLKIHEDWDLFFRLDSLGVAWRYIPQQLIVWHDEDRGSRLSENSPYQWSLDWLRDNEGLLSDNDKRNFLVRNVLHKLASREERKGMAVKIILDAARHRNIPFREAAKMLAKVVLPRVLKDRVKYLMLGEASRLK